MVKDEVYVTKKVYVFNLKTRIAMTIKQINKNKSSTAQTTAT